MKSGLRRVRQRVALGAAVVLLVKPGIGWSYDTAGNDPHSTGAPAAQATGDEAVAIVQPFDQATVHDNDDSLAVDVAVAPALQTATGNQVVLLVDGAAAATQAGNRFQLTKMERGAHTIQAMVVDRDGQTLGVSAPVTIYLWHASQLFPNRAH
jgi:hypothetical protein